MNHNKIYIVNLKEDEKNTLLQLTCKGQLSARKFKRAHILLLANENKTDRQIAQALATSIPTVERTRKRFVFEGTIEAALNEKPRLGSKRTLDEKGEVVLATVTESQPPAGYKRWTMRMLADRLVELGVTDSISYETVRRVLKKTT